MHAIPTVRWSVAIPVGLALALASLGCDRVTGTDLFDPDDPEGDVDLFAEMGTEAPLVDPQLAEGPYDDEADFPDAYTVDSDAAWEALLEAGVEPSLVVYFDMLPHRISDEEVEMVWGAIENLDGEFFVTTTSPWHKGELIEQFAPAPENIVDFLQVTGIDQIEPGTKNGVPGNYDSFPWGFRLPMEAGSFSMTCGYGCGYHGGSIHYSTDWAYGTCGHLLEAPASGWVKYAHCDGNSGYGSQVVVEAGDAGSNRRYIWRVAHMKKTPKVKAGWWIGRGRDLGRIGCSGTSSGQTNCTTMKCGSQTCYGPHLHFTVYRGTVNGASVSGSSLPISKWPGGNDSICGGALSGYNFNGQPGYSLTVQSDGCP